MNAFDAEALLSKSQVFVERGLRARDAGEFDVFHMWAALALELLGKSALAAVHPALVADPTKIESLLYACGRQVSDEVRSITAKTIYERLPRLSRDFDEYTRKTCMLMANRRNEELHSASSPTTDLDLRAWVPGFWRAAEVILRIRGKALIDWVGADESASAQGILADTSRVMEEAIRTRISRCRREFDEKYPPGSSDRQRLVEMLEKTYWPMGAGEIDRSADSYKRQACPACETSAWIFGHEFDSQRRPIEYDEETESWEEFVDTTYVTSGFYCSACGLSLHGGPELEHADLPEAFTEREPVEPEFEEDYGNE